MRRFLSGLLVAFATLFVLGCGDSDNFIFTDGGVVNQPQPGVPTQLAFVQNPAQTTNTDFSTPPIVEIRDAFGDRVEGATNTITVALVNPGTAVLNGQTTRDAVDGRATFPGLSVSQVGTFSLTCSATGLESDSSATFTVTPSLALYSLTGTQGRAGPTQVNQIVQLDPDTGEYIGTLGVLETAEASNFGDLECLPDGTVYAIGFDASDESDLVLVNMTDPSNSTKAFDVTGVDNLFSLAYDANSQTMYAICQLTPTGDDFLCTIDLTTGVATAAPNSMGVTVGGGYGLAFDDSTNTLYLALSNDLHTIDTATGVATLVGSGGTISLANSARNNGIRGLDFHPTTNQLFAVSRGGALATSSAANAGIIDVSNGTSTQTGFSPECAGLSFCESPSVPAVGPARQTGYTVAAITQAFEDISGTGTPLSLPNDGESTEALGFTFNFDGTDYTDIEIDDNGYASFVNTTGNSSPELLPTAVLAEDSLMVWWDDLNGADPAVNGNIYVQTLGSAPNRRFIAQWNINHNSDFAGAIDCQMVLYEGTNVIEFHYNDVIFGDAMHDSGQGAVVGIQTDRSLADLWSIFQPVLTNSTGIRFTPPGS